MQNSLRAFTCMVMCISAKRRKKVASSLFPLGTYIGNIMGEKLFLDFGAKFQRKFLISAVKLQNCYGNIW